MKARVQITRAISGVDAKPGDILELEGRNLELLIKQGYCTLVDAKGKPIKVVQDSRAGV